MAKFLPGYQFSIGPFPEDWAQYTAQVHFNDQVVGLASMALMEGYQPASEALLTIWPALVESALEKVAYHRAIFTDAATGLYNFNFFQTKLYKLLKAQKTGPRTLGLWENADAPALVLALAEIGGVHRLSRKEFLTLASALKTIPEIICLARLGDRRIGVIFKAGPNEAQARLDQTRVNALNSPLNDPYLCGYALYPQDLALDPAAPFTKTKQAAEVWLNKAETALHFAYGRRHPAPVIGYGQLVNSYGQITQLLPQNRVLINLGAPMGALPGQVFSVIGFSNEPKGEITVFETGEAYSLAHAPESRSGRLAAGDKLTFSRIDWSGHPASSRLGLDHKALEVETFVKNVIKLAGAHDLSGSRPLALALLRLDDHERLASVAGEQELTSRLKQVTEEFLNRSPNQPELYVNYGPGTLALVWTGLNREAVLAEAQSLVDKFKLKAPFSVGVVMWPNSVLKPEGLMKAAQDAIFESAMSGPTQITFFGPQTLNISGDHYFDEGDLEKAIGEYQKGLILDPGHLNLLNSLGVCHGRQGEHKTAIAVFDEVLSLEPDNLMANFNKGCSLIYSGQLEDAELALLKARQIAPDNFEVLFHLGKTSLELGHLEQALTALNKASEQKNSRGGIYRLLGQAKLLASDSKGALAAFKKAVKHNPDDADSLSALGLLYLDLDNDQEVALSLFSRSVELDPTNSLFRHRLGHLLYVMGDFKTAEHHLKSALNYGCGAEELQRQLAALKGSQSDDSAQNEPADFSQTDPLPTEAADNSPISQSDDAPSDDAPSDDSPSDDSPSGGSPSAGDSLADNCDTLKPLEPVEPVEPVNLDV
jgi:tetratricopeptide (TPR) repeat protein